MKIEKFILYVLVGFNILTLFIYALQPFGSDGIHLPTFLFVSFCIYMMYKGFNSGLVRFAGRNAASFNNTYISIGAKQFNVLFIFYIVTFSIRYCYELYCPLFDFSSLITRVAIGLSDARAGYLLKGVRSIPWTLYFLVSIIDNLFIVVGLISWKLLSVPKRIILVILLLIEILFWFGKGTNFGVMVILSTILFAYSINYKNESLNRKQLQKYVILALLLFAVSILVFGHNMAGRSGGDLSMMSEEYISSGSETYNPNSILFAFVPENFRVLYLYVTSYLTGGYYNFSKIFDCDFTWCYGLGSNPSLYYLAECIGIDAETPGYQIQIEHLFNIDAAVCWHTGYLWLANDFTLFGVPLIIFIISKFAGYALCLFRNSKDIVSGAVFVVFANMLLLLFANNNYLSSVFYGFMFLFPFWYFKRYR